MRGGPVQTARVNRGWSLDGEGRGRPFPPRWFFLVEGIGAAVAVVAGLLGLFRSAPDRLGTWGFSLMIGGAVVVEVVLAVMWRRRDRAPRAGR